MSSKILLLLHFTSLFLLDSVTSDPNCDYNTEVCTPPWSGNQCSCPSCGSGLLRGGPVWRVDGWVYTDPDPLKTAGYRNKTTYVDPSTLPGLLSNPWRVDGLALNPYYGLEGCPSFGGHIPIFTEGNIWPFVGLANPTPPYPDFDGDAGIWFVNGVETSTVNYSGEPLLLPGSEGANVLNLMNYSVLISAGSRPGNEQPGQCITIINPGDTKPLPIAPTDGPTGKWYTTLFPEMYVSVAGLDPKDVPGWHYSNTTPDYGTPGFAYLFSSVYNGNLLWLGFNKNEGYDPITSGDPGYGVALYIGDTLSAVTDMYTTGSNTAQQDLWALPQYNPQINAQGGLCCYPVAQPGTKVEYHLLSHDETQKLLSGVSPVMHQTYQT